MLPAGGRHLYRFFLVLYIDCWLQVGDILLWLLIGIAVWGCFICITGKLALPGGNLFSLAVLYLAAVLSGRVSAALGMPPLLGSLVVGILFESVPGINTVGHNVDMFWSAVIRCVPFSTSVLLCVCNDNNY